MEAASNAAGGTRLTHGGGEGSEGKRQELGEGGSSEKGREEGGPVTVWHGPPIVSYSHLLVPIMVMFVVLTISFPFYTIITIG